MKHWPRKRLKYLASFQSGDNITGLSIEQEGKYPVYGGNGLRGYTDNYTHEGDFVLVGRQGALCGNINYASGRFWASEHAVVVTPKSGVRLRWLGELLRVMNLGQYSVSAAQPGLSVEFVINLPVDVPPLTEQDTIVSFVGRKTAEIDTVIAVKERMIALLEEKRQALIGRAVTQGLDSSVTMKESGLHWVGQIPSHWKIAKLLHYASVFNGCTPSRIREDYWDGSIPWLSSGKVNDFMIDSADEWITATALKECSLSLVPKGAVVVGMIGQGRTRGMSARLGIEACINQNMAAIVAKRDLNSEFLHYVLIHGYEELREYGRGGNQEALNCEILGAFRIPLPPLSEQEAICDHVCRETARSNRLMALNREQVAKLREYRQTLISAAVTGKLDLTQEASL